MQTSREKWLQFFNTTFYERFAPGYNALDGLTGGAWWQLVSRALDYVPAHQRVLEVGFGPVYLFRGQKVESTIRQVT